MKELTKNILKKWGVKLKKDIVKMGETHLSLDHLEAFILNSDIDGTIGELQRLRKVRKKLKKVNK